MTTSSIEPAPLRSRHSVKSFIIKDDEKPLKSSVRLAPSARGSSQPRTLWKPARNPNTGFYSLIQEERMDSGQCQSLGITSKVDLVFRTCAVLEPSMLPLLRATDIGRSNLDCNSNHFLAIISEGYSNIEVERCRVLPLDASNVFHLLAFLWYTRVWTWHFTPDAAMLPGARGFGWFFKYLTFYSYTLQLLQLGLCCLIFVFKASTGLASMLRSCMHLAFLVPTLGIVFTAWCCLVLHV